MTERDDLINHLASAQLFSRCSEGAVEFLADRSSVSGFDAGTAIVTAGDEGDIFYVMLEGRAEVRIGDDVVAHLSAGDHFGELALLDPSPRSADVVAVTDVSVAEIDGATFDTVLRAVPSVAREMLAGLAAAIRHQPELHAGGHGHPWHW